MSGTPDAPHAAPPAVSGTVLAFDFGTRKIGVALGNTITGTARALATLRADAAAARMAALEAVVGEWQPALIVVGRPLHADGSEHAVTALADQFARQLRARFGVPVEQIDERYTTQVAQFTQRTRRLSSGGDPGRDAVAAQIILQAWLDARPRNSALTLPRR